MSATKQETNDPVQRMVRVSSADKFANWLIEYHGANKGSRRTIVLNLAEQMRWHRLQGRLDARPLLVGLAELWGLRQSPEALLTPIDPSSWDAAQKLCDTPGVDEHLKGFASDPTNDNAVALIQEILAAAAKAGTT